MNSAISGVEKEAMDTGLAVDEGKRNIFCYQANSRHIRDLAPTPFMTVITLRS